MQDFFNVKSNIKVKSNMINTSRLKGPGWIEFAPADLLIKLYPEFKDSRTDIFLTKQQREQKNKALFLAKKIIDID